MPEPRTPAKKRIWLWAALIAAGFAAGALGYEAVARKISLNSPVTFPMDI